MDIEKTLTLRKPVKLGEVEYTELKLREPTAGELAKAGDATTSIGVMINLTSIVAKVPRKVAEDLCQRDYVECVDFFATFATFQPGGETSSAS